MGNLFMRPKRGDGHDGVAGKTPEEIDQHAKDSGLIPKGPNPQGGQDAYVRVGRD